MQFSIQIYRFLCLILFINIFVSSCSIPSLQGQKNKRGITQNYTKDKIIDIPRLDNIVIDGNSDEWNNEARMFSIYANQYGETYPPDNLSARVSMGWNEKGIVLLIDVTDNEAYERGSEKLLWRDDGVQIYMNRKYCDDNILQYSIAPGTTERYKNVRYHITDHRRKKELQEIVPTLQVASKQKYGGYQIEALLPFSNLDITPEDSFVTALQIYVHDRDFSDKKQRNVLEWFYLTTSHLNTHGFQPVRLVKSVINTPLITAKSFIEDRDTAFVMCFADKKLAGKKFRIETPDSIVYEGIMELSKTMAYASFQMKAPKTDSTYSPMKVFYDSIHCATIDLGFVSVRYKDSAYVSYESTIRRFEAMTRYKPVPDNSILFIGSSSFTKWYTFEQDFEGIPAVNLGFGGSQMHHVKYFADRLIKHFNPKAVLLYEGDNDIAAGLPVSDFVDTCKFVFDKLHKEVPNIRIYFVSIKPSPARQRHWDRMKQANDSIRELVKSYPNIEYIDLATPMTDSKGNIRNDLWIYDNLHMNRKGYDLWTELIRKRLVEDKLVTLTSKQ